MKRIVAVMLIVAVGVFAAPADAKIVSVQFDANSGGLGNLAPADVAGFIPAPNWNVTGSAGVGTLTGAGFVDSTGAPAGFTFDHDFLGGRQNVAVGGGATAGDALLFWGGKETGISSGLVSQIALTGMNAAFPNGYDAYFYFGDADLTFMSGNGAAYRSPDIADYVVGTNSNQPTMPAGGVLIVPGNQLAPGNNVAFNGVYTFGPNGNTLLDAGLSMDTAVYSFQTLTGVSFAGILSIGVQIVGVEAPVDPAIPEPAGLGLVGLALLAVRRRRS